MLNTIKNSVLASILIGFGVAVSIYAGAPVGTFLFAFGLIGVCYLRADLFTGKCGYYWRESNRKRLDLVIILIANLVAGWGFGALLSLADPTLITEATAKITSWEEMSIFAYFLKSVFCGAIMYIAVNIWKSNSNLGIIYGIPLFIFCGFQHCIANIIVLGIANAFSPLIFLCILGNLLGSIIIDLLTPKPELINDDLKINIGF
jgi:formate/nitrite transporter FocA (FNT family)